jgi:serine/threonine protein kinase/TolA-binding protein
MVRCGVRVSLTSGVEKMASNYPSESKNAGSVSNPATPGSGPGGTVPDMPLPSVSSTPDSGQSGRETPSGGSGGGSHRRLVQGTLLSGDRYKIDKLLAAGGMGAVYRAVDGRFNRPCAVKEMLDEFQNDTERNQAVEWFGREATLLLDLSHPCIPRVRDFFVQDGRHYLVMDFIEGRTLGEVLEKEGNISGLNGARGVSEARARSWAQQVCSVLSYLHRQAPPIIFRDLKPSNIMVTNRDEVKLIDFGIARTFQSQRQATIIMTVGYAPPEQLHGMPEPRSDLYALGATLHRVLTHHDAVNNKPSIFSFPPIRSLRPDVSPAFEQVLMKALSPAIEQRWASAADMERAVINLPPITAQPVAQPAGQGQFPQRQPPSGPNPPTPSNPISKTPPSQISAGTTGPAGTYINAALGHINAGRVEAAYQAIQQAYALEPNNSLVHRTFGQVFARRQPPEIDPAMRAYNRSLQLNPNDSETHKLVGDIYLFLRKQPLQAVPAYIQSLRLKPDDYEAHQRLAQCYEETNQLDPALREYQEAARLAPQATTVQFALGQLARRMNQFAIAERAFVQVATASPADHQVHFLLGQVYENENKLDDALREYLEAARLAPQNPAVQFALGQLARRMNQFAIAERAFVQVLTINPADHPTRFLLSQVYESENKLDLALEQCNYVVRAMPGNQAAQAMLQRLQLRLGR